ncbi:hypothetical protein [Candidatus Skiveiella danica]|uniref:hypothetical protein n=1 Tax=Candidatus Skiveiella danica TaxID=3386177 RepID=UPI0039B9CD98
MALFELGQVVITRTALAFCEENEVDAADLVRRHAGGDWGDLTREDVDANLTAVRHDLRIFSSYKVACWKVYGSSRGRSQVDLRIASRGLLTQGHSTLGIDLNRPTSKGNLTKFVKIWKFSLAMTRVFGGVMCSKTENAARLWGRFDVPFFGPCSSECR